MTQDAHSGRILPYGSPVTIIALIAALVFLALGARGMVDPAGGAVTFGIGGEVALAFMQTTGARNMGIALLALALIWRDERRALGFLLLAAGLIAAFDFIIVLQADGAAAKHLGYAAGLGGFGAVVLRGAQR